MYETLQNKLDTYIENVGDATNNFELGLEYEKLGQYASAFSYFLRASEISDDKTMIYESLIHQGKCLDAQKDRDNSVSSTYRKAMVVDPSRPEAYYFLCRYYNWNSKYDEAFYHSDLALRTCNFDLPRLKYTDYVDHGLYKVYLSFEKAVSAWWWGEIDVCKEYFDLLRKEHWDDLTDYQKAVYDRYDSKFKFHPHYHDPLEYTQGDHDNLRVKFKNSHKIKKNYSQVYQDLFVLTMTDGKNSGFFVEVGSGRPFFGNNTALLEQQFGWTGIAIDYDESVTNLYHEERPNVDIYCEDATTFKFANVLRKKELKDNVVDYLQLDVDPPVNTYQTLLEYPIEEFPPRVITFEHDYYADEHKRFRLMSRQYLISKGYVMVAGNISPDGKCAFEDWWVNPNLVDPLTIEKMMYINETATTSYERDNVVLDAKDYMLLKYEKQPVERFIKKELVTNGFKEVEPQEPEINEEEIPKPILFEISKKQKPTVWVVDNFYEDPDAVREFALQQEFIEGGWGRGFIGRRTDTQFLFPGLKQKFEQIMGQKITGWEEYSENGKFQNSVAGEPLTWHCDSQQWGGLLYLTPDAPFRCGTSLYAHKHNRARSYYDSGYDSEWILDPASGEEVYFGGIHCDGSKFEPVDVMGNVYNRLIIFDASCIHAASEYFGYNLKTGRLWQMFFFDTK